MRTYSIIDPAGFIRLSQIIPNPHMAMSEGERMLPDATPDFDSTYQTCVRMEPVPADALEVGYTVSYRPLETLKEIRQQIMNGERDRREGTRFPYLGREFDCHERAVQRINTAVQAAQAAISLGIPFSLTWTDANNSDIVLSAEEVTHMPLALAQWGDSLHQTCRALKLEISNATTPEDVLAVTWPA